MSKFWFTVGESEIKVTPIGMWGHKVWQNTATYICSGLKRTKDDIYEYRFTRIGAGSILLPEEDRYNDIFIKDEWLEKPFKDGNCGVNEVYLLIGWVEFCNDDNKRQLENTPVHMSKPTITTKKGSSK